MSEDKARGGRAGSKDHVGISHKEVVIEVIARHMPVDDAAELAERTRKHSFLIQRLQIPFAWIQAARAPYEHYKKNYVEEVSCLLDSNQWESAHQVLLQFLVCPLVLVLFCGAPLEDEERGRRGETMLEASEVQYQQENLQVGKVHAKLNEFLSKLYENRGYLKDWSNRGGIFYDYLHIRSTLQKIEHDNFNAKDILNLPHPPSILSKSLRDIEVLISRLSHWSLPLPRDGQEAAQQMACRDEMTADLHAIASRANATIRKVQEKTSRIMTREVGTHFQGIKLKEDYLRGQLESFATNFLSVVATSLRQPAGEI